MASIILSFFDQEPEYNGQKIRIRGTDGYYSVADLNKAIAGNKRFADWMKTKFAKEVVEEVSNLSGIPIRSEEGGGEFSTPTQKPLIDYDRASGGGVWIHPYLVSAYCLQDPRLYARVSIWLGNLISAGTVNPHILEWTRDEFERGLQFNRDDIREMYGR